MRLIEQIQSKDIVPTRSAAMYYKTEPFYTNVDNYSHTNNWEIIRAIELLVSKGFSVDLIDRDFHDWSPTKEYDLFLGLGVGNSGKNFARYARLSKAKVKVLLSMGPQPDISNDLVLKRYKDFHERTGYYAPPTRTVTDVIGEKFLEIMSETDFIFNIGEKDNKSYKSYLKYNKPILNFYPAINPAVNYNQEWLKTRKLNNYLCFAGNGLICKGVDVVVEAFLNDPTKNLHICGPHENSFVNYYGEKIKNSKNIKYHGFISTNGDLFKQLVSECGFVIFHSSSEGCCTSVATAMKAGLVPVINPWSGIHVDDCGFEMSDTGNVIEIISNTIQKASSISADEYANLVDKTITKSQIFSQLSFTQSYEKALDEVIGYLKTR